MEKEIFNRFICELDSLNSRQLRLLETRIDKRKTQSRVSNLLEKPFAQVSCPHCGSTEKWRWGKRTELQRYRCKKCKRTFNCLTKTPLAWVNKKEQWLEYCSCLAQGFSVRKAAVKCDIHRNTSFNWRHRFLKLSNSIKPENLQGIIESKETYFHRSNKGDKHLKRKARKRGRDLSKVSKKDLVCMFVARDRHAQTYDCLLDKLTTQSILQNASVFCDDALFCSEDKWVYKKFAHQQHLRHGTLCLSKGEYVKKDIVHLANVNHYQCRLLYWMRRFHGVATKYLSNYLSWFRELDEFAMSPSNELLLLRAKEGGKYKFQPKCET